MGHSSRSRWCTYLQRFADPPNWQQCMLHLTEMATLMQQLVGACLCLVPPQHRCHVSPHLQAAMAALDAETETDVTAFADAAAAAGLASDPAARATMAQRLGLQVRSTAVTVMRDTLHCIRLSAMY